VRASHVERRAPAVRNVRLAAAPEQPTHSRRRERQRDRVAAADEEAETEEPDQPARAAERLVGQRDHVTGGQEEDRAGDGGQRTDDQGSPSIIRHCRPQNSWFRLGE
jgi:hypothetical protein